uniref:60S ribosomal protein L36 n=1 Tax=Proboscia inermis TaxID=420281 RepID=A0A7S0C6M1_9STRA|mmetsp:Transcript_35862/g.41576  ORF Transcript_35862/g.41576 Transcript_35862/m.41576 type:complete len:106 (+) Transcript_35862:144-461(+)|eukprot:CAMPEP_0171298282 /NCGR_PEP_ID=MMETSP0816-20121228/7055_1 /TAXON_ID=420281 /ORGANISM="Proboscia inermis, Strain CCAP1064/1" /LENGTH=105 /DNA_ID=CAMNT_0011773203 /DNA_START=145 /DNA_END=462 /DNA_ORIENTATION=+
MAANNGIAQGKSRGHAVTKRDRPAKKPKGLINKHVKMCREIAREVCGLSPYERRILDMIKTGGSSADKRVYKFAKRRLGSHKRALRKREDIKEINAQQRARAAGA